ncbi:hypothetical protein [Massilia sp. YIM B02443]|uniref:hypothetical protein n=1 Tax=Massilia sp. YIM B02443 TaxID=3050127 RepID=UPI0025B6C077|nr:hypothetical protein [Massilia sp. YIM B02443]MDN4036770.1 hypothetical protein [Massilia sp. YIM B02443]
MKDETHMTTTPTAPNTVSNALMRRIGKIKALAERGVDGEQAAAQAMLENILARHNLTMADIEDEAPVRNWVEVHYSGQHERILMFQIIRKVAQLSGSVSYRQRKRVRTSLSVQLSATEHVEVEFLFALMSKALADEFDKVVSAFIVRNRLFGPRAESDDDEPEHERTPEERARLRQIAAMADMINPVNVRKAITA